MRRLVLGTHVAIPHRKVWVHVANCRLINVTAYMPVSLIHLSSDRFLAFTIANYVHIHYGEYSMGLVIIMAIITN